MFIADCTSERYCEDHESQRCGDDTTSKQAAPRIMRKTIAVWWFGGRPVTGFVLTALRVVAFSLIVFGVCAPVSAEEEDAVGQVVRQQGPVTALRQSVPRALRLGAPVYRGDRIITGVASKIEIEFSDGFALSVGSDSDVEIIEFARGGRNRGSLSLLFGIIRTSLSDLWTDGFVVRTRAAIASVRSTDWVSEAREDRSSVFVVSGSVEVTGVADGTRVLLSQDEGTDVKIGGAPTPPKRWGSARVDDVLSRTRLP